MKQLDWNDVALRCKIIESYSKEFFEKKINSQLHQINWQSAPVSRLTSQPKIKNSQVQPIAIPDT